jgi:DNA-binding winged helix-turn-helix (wHTH) protein
MLLKAQGLYVFGPYRLDAHERQLLRDGASVRLPPKAFDMLVALVARAGSLATKEELLSEVWPGTFVEEANLSFTISVVRKALGEHERYIETVPKSGYRFIAPVSVLSAVVGAEPSPPGSIGAQTAKHWNWRRVGVLIGAGLLAISAWQSNFTRRPITTEVADTYFQAMYHRLRWQDGGCARAVPLFERVVTLEPEFDEAYAHLAWCYAYPDRTGQSVAVIEPKATTAAETALRLNPDLARGHAVLGLIKWRLGYDWSLAEKKYRRAINLNPRDSQTLIEFGEYLYASGHLKEGVETVDRGLALDRFRLDSNVAFGFALYLTRQYDNAIAQLRTTLDLDSHWANAQFLEAPLGK